jgi:molybdenum cofactor cytidylyltransferase
MSVTVAAIVPAAGGSGRMGTLKPMLDVRGKSMLLGVVQALLDGGVASVVVVANRELLGRLDTVPQHVSLAVNDKPQTEMIDSIRMGLDACDKTDAMGGYLVCPCDAAGLTAADVRRCIDALSETPDRIVIATHAGRRGHPMIFPASLAGAVRSTECDTGLNRLARNRPQHVREVPCDSPGVVANVNTKAEYERLR